MVMEARQTCATRLGQRGSASVEELLDVGTGVNDGLRRASMGIIHRDIKLGQHLITRQGHQKV